MHIPDKATPVGSVSSLIPPAGGVKPCSPDPPGPGLADPPGEGILVAVSGGGDSVALLRLLHALAPARGWRLAVGHVDHGLRPEAGADAAFVAALAARLGLPFFTAKITVAPRGRSPEEAARLARRQALAALAGRAGAELIALAHTADDQAETVLARVLCGSGPTGLAAMRPLALPFWRPLLGHRRAELRSWLTALGQPWREDASNASLKPQRNRVRHRLLPLAEELVNPRAVAALCRLAELAAAEEDHWLAAGEAFLAAHAWREGASLCLAAAGLAGLSPAAQRRFLRQAVAGLLGRGQHLDAAQLELLRGLAMGRPGRQAELPGGLRAWRETAGLRLDLAVPAPDFATRLAGPGRVELAGLGLVLEAREMNTPPAVWRARGAEAWLPAGLARWPLEVRPPRRGERFHPLGAPGAKRLSRFLIDRKVPAWGRPRVVVVADREGILWVAPHAPAERVRKKGGEDAWLRLRIIDTTLSGPYTQNALD